MKYIYVKDEDGFVVKKLKSEVQKNEIEITKKEYLELSGEDYYTENFGRGGKRQGAGRKPQNGVVLNLQIRVSEKEKEFINYAREHHINYDSLMQG